MKLAFVGLGTMGEPMAGHLISAGHDVTVWNRTVGKSDRLLGLGGVVAESLAEVKADIVFLCVNRSEDVRECLEQLVSNAAPGTLFVDHSTISPKATGELHEWLESKGMRFMDAPITGGSMGAKNGTLTIFCGGSTSDFETAKPYLQAYAKRAELVGGKGAGQMMKAANQIGVGGALLAFCESLAFAKKAGLDVAQACDLLAGGAAGSWMFPNYGPKVLSGDHTPGFSIKNQRKDFAYCAEAAEHVGAAIPGTRLVDQLLVALQEHGHGEEATTLLYEELLRLKG